MFLNKAVNVKEPDSGGIGLIGLTFSSELENQPAVDGLAQRVLSHVIFTMLQYPDDVKYYR